MLVEDISLEFASAQATGLDETTEDELILDCVKVWADEFALLPS